MQTSKHLITALEKSDWLDRLLVLAALASRAPSPFVLAPADFARGSPSPKPDAFYVGADADPEASAALLHASGLRPVAQRSPPHGPHHFSDSAGRPTF